MALGVAAALSLIGCASQTPSPSAAAEQARVDARRATPASSGSSSRSTSSASASSPATETRTVPGLGAPAEIRVDRWGVPHIYAGSEDDAFFAQGFNAARDRLFQIDLWRRRGLGQLSEVFGPKFVDQDRAARMFLFRGDMQKEWRSYAGKGSPAPDRSARRFVDGINAYVDWLGANPDAMPWEFRELNYQPARWNVEDVVRIRSHGLTRNLKSEVMRAQTLCRTGDVQLDEIRFGLSNDWHAIVPKGLDPCLPDDVLKTFDLATQSVRINRDVLEKLKASAQDTSNATANAAVTKAPDTAAGVTSVDRGALLLAALETVSASDDGRIDASTGEPVEGSNSWTVSPKRSATGRAILANDPHRAYSVPSLRYLAHLSAPGMDVIGAGEPALPGVSLGHNGRIAFGLTIFNIDQEDLYVYELDPANPARYRYKGKWEDMRTIREQVGVRGESPRDIEMPFTRHGPVVHVDRERHRAYAVRSGWLENGTSPYFGSLDYMRATTFDSFRQALKNFGAPTLNQVYADVDGNIGWVATGLAPIRRTWDGLLPVPGDGRYEWAGIWRGDDMPSRYNPSEGYIATANAYNMPDGYPARDRRLGFEWTNPSRSQRIHQMLDALPVISMDDAQRLQNDVMSMPAQRLARLLAPLRSDDPETQKALALLSGFDGTLHGESAAAALEEVWQLRHLRQAFKRAALGDKAAAVPGVADMNVMLAALEQPERSRWFGAGRRGPTDRDGTVDSDGATGRNDATARRDRILLESLRAAWDDTKRMLGPDPKAWQWQSLHHNMLEHPLSAAVGDVQRRRIDVGPIPKNGSEYTPSQSLTRATDFRQTNGPSARIVIDVGRWDESRAVNHPGQSGDPASPHYRDLASSWREGSYFPLLYSRAAVEAATERIIRLEPAVSSGPRPDVQPRNRASDR